MVSGSCGAPALHLNFCPSDSTVFCEVSVSGWRYEHLHAVYFYCPMTGYGKTNDSLCVVCSDLDDSKVASVFLLRMLSASRLLAFPKIPFPESMTKEKR